LLNHSGQFSRLGNGFPHSTSPKQLENVLQREWYKIPLETVHNAYTSSPRMTVVVFKAKVGPTK
jgi:hypothetical protein